MKAMAEARQANATRRRLIRGRMMVCPRCEVAHDILQYLPMLVIEKYAEETMPVYKCPACSWIFAPTDSAVNESLKEVAHVSA